MTDDLTIPQKIRAAIDYEEPLFDYARYQLTFLGWALAVAAIYSPAAGGWQRIFLAPAIVIGFALNYRLSILGEKLVYLLMELGSQPSISHKHPARLVVNGTFPCRAVLAFPNRVLRHPALSCRSHMSSVQVRRRYLGGNSEKNGKPIEA